MVVIAVGIAAVILWFGLLGLRATSGAGPREKPEVEDVGEFDVFFVCAECGTEFHVTRLGELHVPRHCGEPMKVEQRPRED